MDLFKLSKSISNELVLHRRTVHAYAETGFDTPKTLGYIDSVLRQNGIVPRPCGGGLIADIDGKQNAKIILRADCDALPIPEKSGLPFLIGAGFLVLTALFHVVYSTKYGKNIR